MAKILKKFKRATSKVTRPVSKVASKALVGSLKVAKKIEKVAKVPAKKILPPKVYKAASKVVRNPAFQTVAIAVASAGTGALIKQGGRAVTKQLIKKAAVKGVKVAAGRSLVNGVAKKVVQNRVQAAAKQIQRNEKDFQDAADIMIETKNKAQNFEPNSAIYKTAVTAATNAATRDEIKAQLSAEGVPDDQLDQAADVAINSLATQAVTVEKQNNNVNKLALIGIPLALALMGIA